MTIPPPRPTLRTLLHRIVATRAPGELHDLDVIIDAAAAAPGAAARAARRHADPTASGPDLVMEVLANVSVNVLSDAVMLVAGGLLARTAARLRGHRLLRWLPRRRITPDSALPPLPDAAVPEAMRHIERGALARGIPAEDARVIAELAVAFWRSGLPAPDAQATTADATAPQATGPDAPGRSAPTAGAPEQAGP